MKKAALLAGVVATMTSFASEYHLIEGKTDWQDPDSYEETAGTQTPPPQGSETDIILGGAFTNAVSSASDYAYLSGMRSIQLAVNAGLLCVVEKDESRELGCAVYTPEDNWEAGTLIKDGEGTLALSSVDKHIYGPYSYINDYCVDVHVKAGRLELFSMPSSIAYPERTVLSWRVDEGATLTIPGGGRWFARELEGGGDVVNESDSGTWLLISSPMGRTPDFSGRIFGKIGVTAYGPMSFSGSANTFEQGINCYFSATATGYWSIAAFGRKDTSAPTSLGIVDWANLGENGIGSARFRFLGTVETPDKYYYVSGMDMSPFTISGGPNGGLDLSSVRFANSSSVQGRMTIEGENTNTCYLSPLVFVSNADYAYAVTKRGPRLWTMKDIPQDTTSSQTSMGLVAVESGTLAFESVDDAGYPSALGFSERLYDWFADESAMRSVPYAVRLGGETATLAFAGTTPMQTLTRPIGLSAGGGHLRSASSDVALKWLGVSAAAAGASTLVLDGMGTGDNTVSGVRNGNGTVSVVKDGSGSWTLSGEQSFSGSLEAKAGTLVLKRASKYRWYRFVIREMYGTSIRDLQLDTLALYDAEGMRVNLDYAFNPNVVNLQAGEVAWGFRRAIPDQETKPSQNPAITMKYGIPEAESDYGCQAKLWQRPVVGKPETYVTIVLRLPEDAPEIAYYDICQRYDGPLDDWWSAWSLKSYAVEASTDGLKWDELASEDAAPVAEVGANHVWHSNKSSAWGTFSSNLTPGERGFEIPDAKRRPASTAFLSSVTEFKVSPGATVRGEGDVTLPSGIAMTVSSSGAGTASVSGIAFPENGSIELSGFDKDTTELPVTFAGDSYANIANWTLTFDGKRRARKLVACDGKLQIVKDGLSVIIR